MELYHLKTFITVAEEGHLTRAAQRLNTSQPAVSAHIKSLEEELGIMLFTRTPKGMRLTQEGEVLQTQAAKALSMIDTIRDRAGALKEAVSGVLRLGLHIDSRYLRIDRLLSHLRHHYGQLDLHLLQRWSWQQFEDLPKGRLDVGFVYGAPPSKEIEAILLHRFNIRVVGPSAWAERMENSSWEAMAGMPWVWTPPSCTFRTVASEAFARRNLKPVKVTIADHEPLVATLVSAGIGLAVMIEEEARTYQETGQVAIWNEIVGSVDLNLVYNRRREKEAVIRAAIDSVRAIWEC
ncbi:LysR family transcriptional regulator [Desulfosarcina cetonica]|uniref:LysR family transcriptional regulator n=1 Tax=Desulfosarcina cetonica TaxID=90730 RepID=UPI0006D24BD5|nr:LysR family transcriptional regulator [Desulfosarcina cetonica]